MLGILDHQLYVTYFYHRSLIEHYDVVADLVSRCEVVSDIEQGDTKLLVQFTKVLQDSGPKRGINHGHRFIGKDDSRLQKGSSRYHDPLPLSAAQLVRITA
ncbi:hypothetical protein ES703_66676 [subsurface metagenome]